MKNINSGSFSIRLLDISKQIDAERELKRINIEPADITLMTAKMLTRCVHLGRIWYDQAKILKQELLALGGDVAVTRDKLAASAEPTDAVLIGTDNQLRKLCEKLGQLQLDLPALARQLLILLEHSATTQRFWKTSQRNIQLTRPLIMGILNVTPDSFSSNTLLSPQQAVEHAWEMLEQGADIIDIGGESTRPGSQPVDTGEELKRILPVLQLLQNKLPCPISIDTWKSDVARETLQAGAEIINDISGFTFDQNMATVVAQFGAGAILMHTRGKPDVMQNDTHYEDLMGEVTQGLEASIQVAVTAGIQREQLVVDPGIGFAKDISGNLEILRRLREFSGLGLPVLIGTSRKGFIAKTLSQDFDARVQGTAATVAVAIANGASIVRVHDVRHMRNVADMTHAIIAA